jgi:hypothetical protein
MTHSTLTNDEGRRAMTSDTITLRQSVFTRFPFLPPRERDALERALRLERQCGEIVRAAREGLPQSAEARAFYEFVRDLKCAAWARYFRLERERRERPSVIEESHLSASRFQLIN